MLRICLGFLYERQLIGFVMIFATKETLHGWAAANGPEIVTPNYPHLVPSYVAFVM